MSENVSIAAQAEIAQLMLRVMQLKQTVRVRFATKGEAQKFRFKAYSVRKADRKSVAKHKGIELTMAQSQFDVLNFTIDEDKTKPLPFAVVISNIDLSSFYVEDAVTGEKLDLTQEDVGISLDDIGEHLFDGDPKVEGH